MEVVPIELAGSKTRRRYTPTACYAKVEALCPITFILNETRNASEYAHHAGILYCGVAKR